jgi:chemotaxis protein methyltransferase CheR
LKPPRAPSAAALAPDDPFWTIKRKVIEQTGHFYYADKDDVLLERLRRRLAATHDASLGAYLARLDDPLAGPEEWRALEGEVSIGETFFFRYSDQFEALQRRILPELMSRRAETRRLRIWSAGCSTGAEPYSIAILLHEMLGEALADWRISILGTDLNEAVLNTARRAEYTSWALRSLTPDQRRAWFTESGGRWSLRSRYRGLVRFARNNLLDLLGPAPPLELTDFDLILCRNVLIYFHPDQVAAVARALVQRLQPDGWMLLGHAESNLGFASFARAVMLDNVAAYRPLEPGAVAREGPPFQPSPAWSPPPAAGVPAWVAPEPLPPAPAPASAPVATPPPAPQPASSELAPPTLAAVTTELRDAADRGDLTAALAAGRRALEAYPDAPALHYYQGLVLHALGRLAEAEESLRRAVYLDSEFVMAHYQLGVTRLAQGRTALGRRSIKTAAVLTGTKASDENLPCGASLTVADLRDLARLHLEAREGGTS